MTAMGIVPQISVVVGDDCSSSFFETLYCWFHCCAAALVNFEGLGPAPQWPRARLLRGHPSVQTGSMWYN